jgi:hypothetical protein
MVNISLPFHLLSKQLFYKMASITQVLETNNAHSTNNIFDFETLDLLFDFDGASNQRIPAITEQDFQNLFLQDQPANDMPPANRQPTAEPSPDLLSAINSPDLISSIAERPLESLVETCSENTTNVGGETGCKPRSAISTEEQTEARLNHFS